MCGRFAQHDTAKLFKQSFGVGMPEQRPRFNIAPTQGSACN